jgi:hypothetical protein
LGGVSFSPHILEKSMFHTSRSVKTLDRRDRGAVDSTHEKARLQEMSAWCARAEQEFPRSLRARAGGGCGVRRTPGYVCAVWCALRLT